MSLVPLLSPLGFYHVPMSVPPGRRGDKLSEKFLNQIDFNDTAWLLTLKLSLIHVMPHYHDFAKKKKLNVMSKIITGLAINKEII